MHPDTRLVSQLQAIDLRMAELEKEVAALPKHIAVIEKTLESHQRRLEADRAALTANQKDRKKLEGDVQMNEQKISKLRDQMLGAKTNEQYRAFQHEIEYAQNEIRKAEDRILELMSESESLDAAVKKAEAALKEEKQLVEAEKSRARERTAADQATESTARRTHHRRRPTPQSDAHRIRTHSQKVARRSHRGGHQRPLRRLPDRTASAIFAGSEKRRSADDVRKLRPIPLLQPAGPRRNDADRVVLNCSSY